MLKSAIMVIIIPIRIILPTWISLQSFGDISTTRPPFETKFSEANGIYKTTERFKKQNLYNAFHSQAKTFELSLNQCCSQVSVALAPS